MTYDREPFRGREAQPWHAEIALVLATVALGEDVHIGALLMTRSQELQEHLLLHALFSRNSMRILCRDIHRMKCKDMSQSACCDVHITLVNY